jgi:putative hydrolase of the HAD superfamily
VPSDRAKAVFFDFGGTLFSYQAMRPRMRALIAAMLERLGLEADRRGAGRAYNEASQRAWAEFGPRRYYLHKDVFLATFEQFARSLGASPSPQDLEWCYEAQRKSVVEGFELRSGCVETLAALRERGLHLQVVSNIDDDFLEPMLERAGLTPCLDAWTSSEGAGSCKPDAGIFRVALDKARVDPEQVVFVGDSRVHDIAGARALGMRTVLVVEEGPPPPGSQGLVPSDPHHEIRELLELVRLMG